MENNNFNPDQEQRLKEIGADLQRIRTEKAISLDTVAAQTLISKRLLAAIEAGDIQELPEPFYIQALINKFAKAIGASETEFISTRTPDTNVTTPTSAKIKSRKYWINFQLRSLHLYLLYILLVVISVKGITTLVERPVIVNQISQESTPAENTVAKSDSVPPSGKPKSLPQFVSQSTNSESVMVGINLQERCWLKVMVDGRNTFEGILPKGTQRTWTGKEQVTIRAGNAGGVVITFNNEQQKILGAPGEVEEITYTVN